MRIDLGAWNDQEGSKVNDLVFVLEYLDENNKLVRKYIEIACPAPHNHLFCRRRVLQAVLRNGPHCEMGDGARRPKGGRGAAIPQGYRISDNVQPLMSKYV